MSRTYLFAANIFKNRDFLSKAITSAEHNGEVSKLTENPGKNKGYRCTLEKGDQQINLVLQAEGRKKEITQSAVPQMSDPNSHKEMQERAQILKEEITNLLNDQKELIAEENKVKERYEKNKQECKKKREFDFLIREEGLQVLKTVKKRLSDKVSSYKSPIVPTSNPTM